MFKRIDHVEIVPRDVEETLNFYINIIGFKVIHRNKIDRPGSPIKEIIFIGLADSKIELLSMESPAPKSESSQQAGYKTIALEVDNMDETIKYLKSKGVELERPPMLLGTSKRAEIKDPDGLTIELRQW